MTQHLRVALLGGLNIVLDGVPLADFSSKKSPALLSYLITTGRTYSREALSGLLWGDSAEERARASLRTTLWDLRQHLPDYVVADRNTVSFDQEAPYWLDVEVFRASLENVLGSGQQSGDPESLLTEQQVAGVEEGLSLYRGDFLAGFYISEAPSFESWVLRTREWTRQLAIQGWHRLVVHYTAQKAYLRGIDAATQLLKIAPWQEETHRRLMRLLTLDGQRGAALAQYESCREMLRDQLGVEPTTETRLLYNRLRSGKALELPEGASSSRDRVHVGPDSYPLPTREEPLLGRDSEMSQLQKLLSGPESRLTALVGESGAGKTRLAYEAAHQLAEEFEDGAWLIRLNGGQQSVWSCSAADDVHVPVQRWTDDDELALPIARSLGLSPVGQTPLAVQLADHLCHREVLLVLDGFQPERWDAETLHRLIRGAPLARILVVSERPVDADWLETLRIGGLSTPPEGTQALSNSREPDNLAGEGALALFLSGARRAVPGLDFDGHTADHIVRLCQLVSGSPLAIKLLTATVGRVPLGEIARRLERLAKKASSSSEDRQDSRSATRCAFAYAWEVLSQDEQFLLSKLVIFEHDFDEEAALEVVGADPTELKELVDTSWLDRLGAGRYVMHRGLRAFVQLKVKEIAWGDYELGTSADASKVSERYRKHYLRLVMTRKQMLVGPTARAACAEIQREWRAVRNAWLQAVAEGQLDLLEKTLEGLTRFLLLVGWLWEGERILHATSTALLRQSRDVGGSLLMARILAHRARALNVQRRGEEGVAAAQAALDSMPNGSGLEAPARAAEAEALVEWGRGLSLQGEFQLATERLKQALTLTGDDQAVETKARAFHSLGVIALSTESYEEALAYLRRALALYDVMDHRTGGAAVRNDLGMAAIRQRQYPDAAAYLGDALSLAQKTGDRRQEGVAYSHFGRLAAAQGDYDRATGHLERALRIAIDLGDRYVQAEVQVELAASLLHQGETGQAWKRSILAVEISHALGERASEARAWLVAGHVFSELNMLDQATRSCRMALELARTFGGSMLITEALACLARIGLARDDLGRARSLVEQILGRLETQSLPGGSEALRVYLICYQVLKAAKDSRADDVLSRVSSLYGQEEGGASVHYSPNGGSELPDGEDVPRL